MTNTHCPYCHASLKSYWHALTPGLISALSKLLLAIQHYGRNSVHIHDEMKACKGAPFQLSDFEWNNFTKLRFHALAFKVEGKPGQWGITRRGGQFLKGHISVPARVKTFRNRVLEGETGHSKELVHVNEFRRQIPWFESLPDFDIEKPESLKLPCTRQGSLASEATSEDSALRLEGSATDTNE